MVREAKSYVVEQLAERIKNAQFTTMTDFSGLKVTDLNNLRDELREAGGEYRVVKNRLFLLALNNFSLQGDPSSQLTGPTGVVFSKDDALQPVKVAVNYSKKFKKFNIKGGIVGRRVLSEAEVKVAATIPSQEYLYAQVVGAFQSPLSGLASTLNGLMNKLVTMLQEIADQKAA